MNFALEVNFRFFTGTPQVKAQGANLLGQLFPQTTLNNVSNSEEIKKQQEEISKESDEKNKENEKSWKRMKFGYSFT